MHYGSWKLLNTHSQKIEMLKSITQIRNMIVDKVISGCKINQLS